MLQERQRGPDFPKTPRLREDRSSAFEAAEPSFRRTAATSPRRFWPGLRTALGRMIFFIFQGTVRRQPG